MAEPSFETIWRTVLIQLKPGMSIRNWTSLKGYLTDEMSVVNVAEDKIVVQAPNAKHLQPVPKADFQAVWKVWPEYKSGQVERQAIRDMTRFSKYIISILHHVETD